MGTRSVNRTERLATIEHMLFRSANGLRVVEIAEACGVDRRTVYRDLTLLAEIGIPIIQANGRYFIKSEHYVANVRLNQDEAIALFLAVRVLSQYIDQQNPHLVAALRKLSRALPEPVASHLLYLVETAYNGAVDPGFISTLETVSCAWSSRQRVKLWCALPEYDAAAICEFAIYFIEPAPNGQIYLVGYDLTSRRIRSLPLQRVKRAKMLRMSYDIPAHFDARPYLSEIRQGVNGNPGSQTAV